MTGMGPRGEAALARLLATLEPRLDGVGYEFTTFESRPSEPELSRAAAVVREEEGWTVVRPAGGADPGGWARIVLTVHSDLTAVGLLAAVAARLADEGIPVNAMAGWFHDHLYVPWPRRDDAMAALVGLQREAAERESA